VTILRDLLTEYVFFSQGAHFKFKSFQSEGGTSVHMINSEYYIKAFVLHCTSLRSLRTNSIQGSLLAGVCLMIAGEIQAKALNWQS
jgi:hypothetical protein